ncbi:hypothetical protein ACIBCT_32970 [Streptosporangium sp. NPDC050855]|uniref:hypothetical protein n=1 Tax=Streptosporangium sp. NPDC050855 TaxID=3366194 RepID=UPI00379AC193
MVEVNTEALKAATRDLIDTFAPIAQQVSTLAQGTHLSPVQWGAVGAATVAREYAPAREYQAKQAEDFVKCVNGINAGLLSVVLHYRQAELETATAANDTGKMIDLKYSVSADRSALDGATRNKDLGPTD